MVMSGVLTRMANALWSSGVAWLERVWGRAAPDAPERGKGVRAAAPEVPRHSDAVREIETLGEAN